MHINFLDKVVSDIVGKQGPEILDLLFHKKDVNEFLIAKKLNMTINQVRNILYKLSNFSLVTFTRKKDKKKGWYTYFWTLDIEKALELLAGQLRKEIENLEQQLKGRLTKRFYICKTCKTEVGEETALLNDFVCSECGEIYSLADSKKTVNGLEREILRLKKQMESVLQELGIIKEAKERKRMKEEKKLEKSKKKKKKRKKTRVVKKKKLKKERKKRKKRRKIKIGKGKRRRKNEKL